MSVAAAVLTGGRSTRMGTDKAMVPVEGVPMARRVADALEAAGLAVTAIGGDAEGLAALGLAVVPDQHPGEGPLGGILTALEAAATAWVVVAACDQPWLGAEQVTALIGGLDDGLDVVTAASGDRVQPLLAAWRVASRPAVAAAFEAGERSPRRLLPHLRHRIVDLGTGPWSTDVDQPLE